MKKQFLASAGIAALMLAGPAVAAPPPPEIFSWTGFYAGGNVGYSWGNVDTTLSGPTFPTFDGEGGTLAPFSNSASANGFIGGIQAGYNSLLGPQHIFVFGVETDFQGSAEKATTFTHTGYSCDFEGDQCNITDMRVAKIHWFGTVRGRFGQLITPTTLVYATGGLAYGKVSLFGTITNDSFPGFQYGGSAINVGYVIGAGIEGVVPTSNKWTWKVEYLYVDLGSINQSGYLPYTGTFYNLNAQFTDQILRVGFNYKLYP